MTRISSAFDAYINANILLVVAFTLWLVTRFILNRTGMRHAYGTQLRLLNAVFLAIVFSPFIAYAYKLMAGAGLLPGSLQLNLSDIMLAQYLNGSIAMSPTEMERLLNLRETLGAGLLQPAGWVQYTIVTLMLAGFLACLARCGIASFKLRQIIADSYPWRRFGRVHLRLSDQALVPFSARGLRRRYIVVPANMLLRPQDMRIA
ncbi:MAG TPA: biotin transporter BioY, partial [Rhodobacteraceae bacterium]|nr:biotin transporter BioY [Paracoccaceae bacterium]